MRTERFIFKKAQYILAYSDNNVIIYESIKLTTAKVSLKNKLINMHLFHSII